MARFGKNQLGFSAIEGLIITVVVVVLATGTWIVFKQHKSSVNKDTTSTSQPTTKQPQSNNLQPQQTATQYLTITEWGVRMTVDSKTATLYYYINPQLPDVAYLSLKSVSDIAPDCAPNKTAIAAIFRQTPAERQDATSKGLQVASLQVGNYYYGYTKANAGCTDGTAATQAAINKAQPQVNLQDTFKTLATVPQSAN